MIYLVNGPPRSGKDTVAEILSAKGFIHLKCAAPLKAGLGALLDLEDSEQMIYFETQEKELHSELFRHYTPREALIELSEAYAKELFGGDIFGHLLVKKIRKWMSLGQRNFAVSDCGFKAEAAVVIQNFPECTKIIEMHRPGCDFKNDSRAYLPDMGVEKLVIHNDGTMDSLRDRIICKLTE